LVIRTGKRRTGIIALGSIAFEEDLTVFRDSRLVGSLFVFKDDRDFWFLVRDFKETIMVGLFRVPLLFSFNPGS